MSSSGSPSPEANPPAAAAKSPGIPLKTILFGLVAVLLIVFIATQVIGVLYTIAFPTPPPLPPNVTELSHKNTDYGVDEWLYGTEQDPCAVVKFYQEQGGDCRVANLWCENSGALSPRSIAPGEHVARCVGEKTLSIFALRWDAVIAAGYSSGGYTQFRLSREIFWTGQVPPMPTPGQEF